MSLDCSTRFRKKIGHCVNQSKSWFDRECKHAKKEMYRLTNKKLVDMENVNKCFVLQLLAM